jgi:hypothetical protein
VSVIGKKGRFLSLIEKGKNELNFISPKILRTFYGHSMSIKKYGYNQRLRIYGHHTPPLYARARDMGIVSLPYKVLFGVNNPLAWGCGTGL